MAEELTDELEELESISRGSLLFFLGTPVQYLAGFGTNLLLTTTLGATTYGVYAYGKRIVSILLTLLTSGPGTALLRYLPKHADDARKRNEVLGLIYLLLLLLAFGSMLALVFFSPLISEFTLETPDFTSILKIFGLILFIDIFITVIGQSFKAIEIVSIDIFLRKIIRPLAVLGAVLVGFVLGTTIFGFMVVIAVAYGIVLLLAVTLLVTKTDLVPKVSISREEVIELVTYSGTVSGSRVGTFLYTRVDLLMIGILLSSTEVGIYNVALLVTGLLQFPLSAINQLFPTIASRLYETDQREQLSNIYSVVTRWSFSLTLFPAVWLVVYRLEILRIFGESFSRGESVLLLFAIGQLVTSSVGPTGFLLMMTDNQNIAFLNRWVFGIANVVFNYLFILKFGFIGAALVTASTLALLNISRLAEIWYLEDLFPYSRSISKPVVAVLPAALVMVGLHEHIPSLFGLFLGGVIGFAVYALALAASGLEEVDKQMLSAIIPDDWILGELHFLR